MKIARDAAVSLRVEILDEGGARAGAQELVYLHGHGNMFPKVEAALEGLEPGGEVSVRLAPVDGFGERDPGLVRRERRERLPPNVALGSQLQGQRGPDGHEHAPVFRVTELTDTEATLDANHALAGRTVELRCSVQDVRAATPEEMAHGHAHGPHDHH